MKTKQSLSGTFTLNKHLAIHRWYPYIEGYSSLFVENEIDNIEDDVKSIFDPFGGCGTTPLVASFKGIKSYYCEINPFMSFVCDTKINVTKKVANNKNLFTQLDNLITKVNEIAINSEIDNNMPITYNGFEKFFDNGVLSKLLAIKNLIKKTCTSEETHKIALLALSSIAVTVSKMTRRGDLRYATEGEKSENDFDVIKIFNTKISEIIEDVRNYGNLLKSETVFLNDDARKAAVEEKIDCVITSPPYLNGTNYIRNTKLELKLSGFIEDEKELPKYHSKGIIAGINSVSKRSINHIKVLDEVKPYIKKIEPIAYDKRIPLMVAGYFYDMNTIINHLSAIIRNKGHFIMDIGDSQFCGVHIPTHELLSILAQKAGFKLYDETILRKRYSLNGMQLTQRVLRFKLLA